MVRNDESRGNWRDKNMYELRKKDTSGNKAGGSKSVGRRTLSVR